MGKAMTESPPEVGKRIRFKGIKYAASVLQVSEEHLRFVLRGERKSERLMAKIREQFPALLEA